MNGSCHCGRVTWTLKTPPTSVTACNCTVCRRYGVLWAYGHIGHDQLPAQHNHAQHTLSRN